MSEIVLEEQVAAATPGTNEVIIYFKSDGLLYWKDDAGAERAATPQLLANAVYLQGKESGGTARNLAGVTGSNVATYGDASIATAILGSALTITPNTSFSGTILQGTTSIKTVPGVGSIQAYNTAGNSAGIWSIGASGGQGAVGAYDETSGHVGVYLFSDNSYAGIATINNAGGYTSNPIAFQPGGIVNNISDLTVGVAAGTATFARLTAVDNTTNRPVQLTAADNDSFVNIINYATTYAVDSSGWSYALGTSDNNGTPNTGYRIRGDANAFIDGSWTGGGADDATLLEWLDGNPDRENRIGLSVVMTAGKIHPATDSDKEDDIVGIISCNPSSVGNCPLNWPGKYERDELGGHIMQDYKVYEWDEVVPAVTKMEKRQLKLKVKKPVPCVNIIDGKAIYTIEEKEILEPQYTTFLLVDPDGKPVLNKIAEAVLDKEGKEIAPARYEQATYKEPVPEDYVVVVEPEKTICHCHADYKMPEGVVPPPDAKVTVQQRRVPTNNYDPAQKYETRLDRALAHKEWAIVGRNGQVPIRKGQPVKSTWKLMREISDTVGLWLID